MAEVLVTLADRSSSSIDVCSQCRWAFIEFFDGEPVGVARAMDDAFLCGAAASVTLPLGCPDCDIDLQQMRYESTGPALWRCGECLGIVTDAESLRALGRHRPPTDGVAAGVLAKLARLLGLGADRDAGPG